MSGVTTLDEALSSLRENRQKLENTERKLQRITDLSEELASRVEAKFYSGFLSGCLFTTSILVGTVAALSVLRPKNN